MLPEVPHFFHISYTKKKAFSRDPESQPQRRSAHSPSGLDMLTRSSFPARPSARRGHRAPLGPHLARPARVRDAEHPSHWLDLLILRVSPALTAQLLPLAARWWSIPALQGRKASFSSELPA